MNEFLIGLSGAVLSVSEFLFQRVIDVLSYPVDPGQRIYFLYLLTSALFALYVFIVTRPKGPAAVHNSSESLFGFLFPKEVWNSPSAWLDVRYFFFHQIFRVTIYGAFLVTIMLLTFETLVEMVPSGMCVLAQCGVDAPVAARWILLIAVVAAVDLVAYGIHYCQHKVPLLWEFHKVHHSATVMHPLTNYREHPVDNIAYAIGTGIAYGVVGAAGHFAFGLPEEPSTMNLGVIGVAYNLLGYNLRHSHIWLRWPGPLAYVFGSPAHHQVHHSCHPDHIDKNFAFIFPIWDVVFGTMCLPKDNRDVKYGLGTGEEGDYRSCLGLYVVPIRKAAKRIAGTFTRVA